MTYRDKLKRIQRITEKTQVELAELFRVSFPTMNSWLNGRSIPREKAQAVIDLLYQEYTGVESVDGSELAKKRKNILEYQKQFPNPLKIIIDRKELYDAFILELTYHTNSIEGSTLNEPEVRAVIFDGATIPNKTLVEHQEAKNHQAALGTLLQWIHRGDARITEDKIKKLHTILLNGIFTDAGQYRSRSVRIVGSHVVTANYLKVPELMRELIPDMNRSGKNIYRHLATTHARFEQIHPFSDGNGRVGRLLLHWMALRRGLPPVLIQKERKQAYFTYLERAQIKEEYIFLESFICDAILESYKLLE